MVNPPKNIAMVVYSFFSRDARVRKYAEYLANRNYRVEIISLNELYNLKIKNINLHKYPLGRKRLNSSLWYFLEYSLFFFYSFLRVTLLVFRNRIDILHIHNMPDFLVFTGLIPKLLGTKIIMDIHDPMPELYQSKFNTGSNKIMVKILCLIEKLSVRFSDKVITANPEFKKILLKRLGGDNPQKISVIENYPDTKIFRKQKSKTKSRNFRLLYMGTVDKRFALDIPVLAIKSLKSFIPGIRLTIIPKIVHEGQFLEYLKNLSEKLLLQKFIKFVQPQPLESLVKFINDTDLGIVLAARGIFTESIIPVKLLEFMQMGIPVIATKTKILSKTFTKGEIYYLKENSVNGFISAVRKLYKDRKFRKKISVNANKFLKINNWEKEKLKYMEIVSELIEKNEN